MTRRTAIVAATVVGFLAGVASATAAWTATTATTSTLTAAPEFPPITVSIPTIVGTAQDGQTLKVDVGSYSPPATSTTYEWLRCDSNGANCASTGSAAQLVLAAADQNKTIRVRVTPKNGAMPGDPALSEPTPQLTKAPNSGPTLNMTVLNFNPGITGTTTVGQTLTASDGLWWSLLGVPVRQWLRCDGVGASCVAIAGATNQTYTLVAADRGARLRLRVTGYGVLGLGGSNTTGSLATEKVT